MSIHSFRCPPELWASAQARASAEHRTLTDVLTAALAAYAAGGTSNLQPTTQPRPGAPKQAARPALALGRSACCTHCTHPPGITSHDQPCRSCPP